MDSESGLGFFPKKRILKKKFYCMSLLAARHCLGSIYQVKCFLGGPLIFIPFACVIGGGRGGAGGRLPPSTLESGGAAPPPTFLQMVFFLHANAQHSKPKVASRCRHAANIAFDLFNIFLYVIARKVRKCPLSPFVTSNVVLSCLVRMADILARLAQKADSLSALQLTGALWYSLSNTPNPPPLSSLPPASAPTPHFLDRSAAPVCSPVYLRLCSILMWSWKL